MDMKRDLFCLLWAHDYNTHTVKQAQDCLLDYCGIKNLTLNFMAPFYYGWGSTASRLQPLRGGSLLFTIQFPATHIFAAETVNCICAAEVSNCIIATE